MTERCEPPEGLRGVNGFHWLEDNQTTALLPYVWLAITNKWRRYGGTHAQSPLKMEEGGYRYVAPVTPPATVAALVEALEEADAALVDMLEHLPNGNWIADAAHEKLVTALATYRGQA